jgi:hypothetical protein
MDTTQVTQVPGSHSAPSRRRLVALLAGLVLAGGLAVGIRATAAEPATSSTTGFTPVSVAPGHTQPATTIHRIAMQPTSHQGG